MKFSTATLGRSLVILGIVLIVIGLVAGFTILVLKPESIWVNSLGLVPFGFALLLAGTTLALLTK